VKLKEQTGPQVLALAGLASGAAKQPTAMDIDIARRRKAAGLKD
jgi:hypothetical protein